MRQAHGGGGVIPAARRGVALGMGQPKSQLVIVSKLCPGGLPYPSLWAALHSSHLSPSRSSPSKANYKCQLQITFTCTLITSHHCSSIPVMSRGTAGWLPCATAVFLVHLLGFDSPYIRQLIFGISAALHWQSGDPSHSIKTIIVGCLHYVVIILAVFQLARSLLATTNSPKQPGLDQVKLFPCKTTHSRTFPKKHSFDYSYLVIGVPVGWEGISGGLVSSGSAKTSWLSKSTRGWYHIDPADYLERGNGHLGLRGKLDAYLQSQVCISTGRATD